MLTAIAIKNRLPELRPFKMAAGGGLYLLVNPNGSRWWRFKYRFGGKEKLLALGVYPEISLKQAGELRDSARKQLSLGFDPSASRKSEKQQRAIANADSFEGIAREWLELQSKKLAPNTKAKAVWILETFVFPFLGTRGVSEILAPDVLAVLRRIESKGAHETAHRTKSRVSQIFRYAVATGRAQRDPTADLRGVLAPVVVKSHAALTDPQAIAELLRAIDGYGGSISTRAALKLAPLVFVRPGELRMAEWSEFDLDAAEWRIPAARMKMRDAHIVPLATQAVTILRELEAFRGYSKFVFPSVRTSARPMSENTINASLRRMGYTTDQMTGHGFRALASTRLNEMGWSPDVIERQLAHKEQNQVRAVYNRAKYLDERRRMMQAWADYLEGLKAGGNIVPLHKDAGSRRH